MSPARRCRDAALPLIMLLALALGLSGRVGIAEAAARAYGQLPLSFEANRGQADPSVEFVARSTGYQLFLAPDEAVLVLRRPGAAVPDALRLNLAGASAQRAVGVDALPGTVNYLTGSDPARWRTSIPTYAKVLVPGVYPGVDLVYYGTGRQLEYDFILAPGADPASIRLAVRGLAKGDDPALALDGIGDLTLRTPGGDVVMRRPVAYQTGDGGAREPVDAAYVLIGSPGGDGDRVWHVGFALGDYDRSRPLVIDPVVSYLTYLGGSRDDAGMAIAVRDGHAYVTGYTDSLNFPGAGSRQADPPDQDAFVAKLNASGTALEYATYLGGDGDDAGMGIAVDAEGQAHVTGYTDSADFSPAPLFGHQGGLDAFVVKLNAAGNGFVYATYLGGGADDAGLGIALDVAGNAHVTGWTDSDNFPATASPLHGDRPLRDAFVTKLSPAGTALVYSTPLGGDGSDEGHAVAVDAAGLIYVTGGSTSTDLPTSANARLPGGGQDAFVAKLDPAAAGLAARLFLTYIGGAGEDAGRGIAADPAGLIYVTGSTASANFPLKSTAYQGTHGGQQDAFVAKFNPAGLGPNQQLMYSSFLGGSGDDAGLGLALDEEGQIYVTGFTTSHDFPLRDAAASNLGGARDAFVAKFDLLEVGPASVRYSTYLGGSGEDEGYGVALDAAGNAYVTGLTRSADFPGAAGSLSGPEDAFVAKLSEPDLVISVLTVPATAGAGDVIPVTVETRNQGGATAAESTTEFYLSPDSRLNVSADTFLGRYTVPELGPGEAHPPLDPPLTLTLPAGLAPATYFLFAVSDAAGVVGESFESNNRTKRDIAIGADLRISTLSVTSSGSTMTVTDTTRNAGGALAAASRTSFFMMTPTGEVILGSRDVGQLDPGAATPPTPTTLTIPAGTPAGSFTVIARADADNAVIETDEANNSTSTPFNVGVDLTVSTLADVPSITGAGKSFTVKSSTSNLGFIGAAASTTDFFLSPTAEYDPATARGPIGTRAIPALGSGEASAALSATLTVPENTPAGPYFVVARANSGTPPLVETRTTNNTRARSTLVGPDLQVTFVSPTSVTTAPGGTVNIKDTTRNLGGGDAPASETKYYFSPDAVYDPGDLELGRRNVGAIIPRGSDANSAGVPLVIPQGTVAGNYFIIVRANAGTTPVGETNTTNNTMTAAVTVAGVDLVVSALTVSPGASSNVTITDTTTNQGTAQAAASWTRYYVSASDVFDEGTATVLGERQVGVLAAGATSEATTTWPLPAGMAPDTYTVFARADVNNQVPESDESNNRRARSLDTRGSDLVVTSVSYFWGTGPALTVSDTTRNLGPATAGASRTRIYLSLDAIWDPSDTPLGPGRDVVSLAAATQSTGATPVVIPAVTAAGDYHLIARADDAAAVREVDKGNNTAATPIAIRPDLAFAEYSVPATTVPGTTIKVTGKIINHGPIPAGPSVLKIFLSLDDRLDAGDPVQATVPIDGMASTRTVDFEASVVLPADVSESRFVIGRIDPDNQTVESDETNNTRVKSVAVGSDLTILTLTGPTPSVAGAGSVITVRDTVRNRVSDVGSTTMRFYLSPFYRPTDVPRFDRSVEIGNRAVPALGPNKTHSGSTPATIPQGTPPGSYFVVGVVDADQAVAEGNEGNNDLSFSIAVGPDLVVSALAAPPVAEGSSTITVTDTTANVGGADAVASITTFHLSSDTAWQPTDLVLGSRSIDGLGTQTGNAGSTPLLIPSGIAPGTYYVIARADTGGTVNEFNETNNTAVSGEVLIGADLTVALSVPATTVPGAAITIADTVANRGGAQAGQFVVRVFLSTNNGELDAGDTLLSTRTISSLAGGATSPGITPFTVPLDTPATGIFIIAHVDPAGQVTEIREDNNVTVAAIKTAPDLQVTILTAPDEGAPGTVITIKDTTKNFGARPGRTSIVRYVLSGDQLPDAGDLVLAERQVGDLAFGGTSLGDIDVLLPATIPAGSYFVIAQADASHVLDEALEDNNIKVRPINLGADFIITAVTAPGASGAGKQIEVGASTKNQGAAAAASVTYLFLSLDETLSSGDRFLGSVNVTALGANATRSASTVVTIPADIATVGQHFIIAQANGNGAVGEANTGNNTRARSMILGADLVVSTLSVQTTGGVGLPLAINDVVRNDGAGDAPASTISYYLAPDNNLDSRAILIGHRQVPALGPGASSGPVPLTPLTIPAGTPAGTYQVFAVADAPNNIREINEGNNTRFRQTKIGPDLVTSTVLAPGSASPGGTITVTATIVNQGAGHAGAFTARVYLSADVDVSPGVEVGSLFIDGGVAPDGSTGPLAIGATIPPGTVAGSYDLIVVADADNAVSELSDANNRKTRSLNVVP